LGCSEYAESAKRIGELGWVASEYAESANGHMTVRQHTFAFLFVRVACGRFVALGELIGMLVQLDKLKPNPKRDFIVDPMVPATIDNLEKSIKEDGFWGGVVCRKNEKGEVEIAAGHHRVEGAIRAGVKTADLFVSDKIDDVGLIRIYAMENATQRGQSGTAQVGTVAAALRFLAKQVMVGLTPDFRSDKDMSKVRSHLTAGDGVGEPLITEFLQKVPGINKNSVTQQLALLKQSGDYARIIGEVADEVEKENAKAVAAQDEAARAKVERAHKAREKANDTPVTFDLVGVSKILDQAGLLEAFRKAVTKPAVIDVLPVENQAKLAQRLVDLANKSKPPHEITARYITERVGDMVYKTQTEQRRIDADEDERLQKLLRSDWFDQAAEYQHQFSRQANGMLSHAEKLQRHNEKRPKGMKLQPSPEIRKAIANAKQALKIIGELI
jgi:hypothetical protein